MIEGLPPANVSARARAALAYRIGVLALVTLMFGIGIWMQSRVYLNHDVAWITHSARWLLEGRRFGSGIVDVNPPLVWYFTLPAAALAKAGVLSEPSALRLWVWLVCGGSLLLAHRLLAPLRTDGRQLEAAAIILGAAYAMTIVSAGAFGQRDFLAFVLGLPWCLLVAWRIDAPLACPRPTAVLTGVLAAIAFGLKPWLLAVPLLLESLRAAEQRSLKGLLRPETLALGLGLVAYVALVAALAPDYLRVSLPLARATYWAYDESLSPWVYGKPALEPALYGLLLCALTLTLTRHARVLLAAIVGFGVSHWAQGKGFAYHAFPALATATVFFAYAVARMLHLMQARARTARPALRLALVACLALLVAERGWTWSLPARQWLAAYDTADGYVGQMHRALVDVVNRYAPRGSYVYAFSSHPFPAFPTMSYAQAEWGSAFPAQFAIPAYVRRHKPPGVELAAIERAVDLQRRYVLDEFRRYRPRVVLVQSWRGRLGMRGPFDDVAFYSEDPQFALIWRSYREAGLVDSVTIYVREP
jgi:hypothetical protein